jgi:hypothetical protein
VRLTSRQGEGNSFILKIRERQAILKGLACVAKFQSSVWGGKAINLLSVVAASLEV